MEFLPAELHVYLSRFLDESTRLLFPLTCRSLLASLGTPRFSLEKAVQSATRDDNLELLLFFLRDKTSPRRKTFYSHCVFTPLLRSDSMRVARWFCSKGYVMYDRKYWFQFSMTTSIRVLDLLLKRSKTTYDDELLLKVLEFDRVDILRERYPSLEFLAPGHWQLMLRKDALRCLRYCESALDLPERFALEKSILREGASNIVDDFLIERRPSFCADLVSTLIRNPNYHSTFVFDFYKEEYHLSREQSLYVVRTKHPSVAITLLANTTIDAEHCQAALDSASHEVVHYVFSRFEGVFSSVGPVDVRHVTSTTLELVASKLESISCLTDTVIHYDAVELIPRLVEETGLAHIPLSKIIFYHRISPRVFHAYLTLHEVPVDEQLDSYSIYGRQFITIFEREGAEVCREVLTLAEKKERAAKRRRLA